MRELLIGVFLLTVVAPTLAQKLSVKIISREDNETDYTYVVAGFSHSTSNANVN
jgi:hypothetical protein